MYKDIHGSFIHNGPEQEKTQTSIQVRVHIYKWNSSKQNNKASNQPTHAPIWKNGTNLMMSERHQVQDSTGCRIPGM